MGYMKQNVNVFLVFLLLFLIGSIVGYMMYYHDTFRKVASDLDQVQKDRDEKIARLNLSINTLLASKEKLRQTSSDLTSIQKNYEQMKSKNEDLTNDLAKTQASLNQKTRELDARNAELSDSQDEIKTLKDSVTECTTKSATLQSRLDSCRDDLHICEAGG